MWSTGARRCSVSTANAPCPTGRSTTWSRSPSPSPLTGVVEQAYYAEGIGLVALETIEGEPETQLGLVAYDEP